MNKISVQILSIFIRREFFRSKLVWNSAFYTKKKTKCNETLKVFTIFYMMYISKKLYLTVHTIHSIQTIRCICVRKIYWKVYFSTCVICMFFFGKWKCRISSRCILDKFPQTSSNHYLSVRFDRHYSVVISLRWLLFLLPRVCRRHGRDCLCPAT